MFTPASHTPSASPAASPSRLSPGELSNRSAAALIDRPVIGASAAVFALAGALDFGGVGPAVWRL